MVMLLAVRLTPSGVSRAQTSIWCSSGGHRISRCAQALMMPLTRQSYWGRKGEGSAGITPFRDGNRMAVERSPPAGMAFFGAAGSSMRADDRLWR